MRFLRRRRPSRRCCVRRILRALASGLAGGTMCAANSMQCSNCAGLSTPPATPGRPLPRHGRRFGNGSRLTCSVGGSFISCVTARRTASRPRQSIRPYSTGCSITCGAIRYRVGPHSAPRYQATSRAMSCPGPRFRHLFATTSTRTSNRESSRTSWPRTAQKEYVPRPGIRSSIGCIGLPRCSSMPG